MDGAGKEGVYFFLEKWSKATSRTDRSGREKKKEKRVKLVMICHQKK